MRAGQLQVFPDELMLYRCASESGLARFVYLTIQCDLFGGVMLVVESGRIGATGRLLRAGFEDEGQALTALGKLARTLAGRGYVVANLRR